MKLTTVITLGAVFVLLASVYVLNRPQLTTIDAAIPQNFPGDGFSHEVFEQLLQTYLDGAGHVLRDSSGLSVCRLLDSATSRAAQREGM